MTIPNDLKYTKDHEWARVEGNVVTIGITHHAQQALGDIVFCELPAAGTRLTQHQVLGVVESVKAVSDVYSPLSGTVKESNADVVAAPQSLNEDPYGKAWMLKIEVSNPAELAGLMDAAAYDALLKSTTK
jgi:glycine cleavage system H protein